MKNKSEGPSESEEETSTSSASKEETAKKSLDGSGGSHMINPVLQSVLKEGETVITCIGESSGENSDGGSGSHPESGYMLNSCLESGSKEKEVVIICDDGEENPIGDNGRCLQSGCSSNPFLESGLKEEVVVHEDAEENPIGDNGISCLQSGCMLNPESKEPEAVLSEENPDSTHHQSGLLTENPFFQ